MNGHVLRSELLRARRKRGSDWGAHIGGPPERQGASLPMNTASVTIKALEEDDIPVLAQHIRRPQ
jgi:hypothetical protein